MPSAEFRERISYPGVDEYGLAAATHYDHVQWPRVHVRRQEPFIQPGRQVCRDSIGGQSRGWKREYPIANHKYVNFADPQRVTGRNQLVAHLANGAQGV